MDVIHKGLWMEYTRVYGWNIQGFMDGIHKGLWMEYTRVYAVLSLFYAVVIH